MVQGNPRLHTTQTRSYAVSCSVDAVQGFKYLVPTYNRPDIVFDHGKGPYLYDR